MLNWVQRHQSSIADFWAPLTSILANVLVVVALIIAFLTYHQQQRDAAVAASMSYVNQFNSGEILQARNTVFRSWLPYDFNRTDGILPKAALDALVLRVLSADEEADPTYRLRTALVNIVAFYDSVAACARSQVCDNELLAQHLEGYGLDFLCLHQSFIEDQISQSHLTGFGAGLMAFAGGKGCLAGGEQAGSTPN